MDVFLAKVNERRAIVAPLLVRFPVLDLARSRTIRCLVTIPALFLRFDEFAVVTFSLFVVIRHSSLELGV